MNDGRNSLYWVPISALVGLALVYSLKGSADDGAPIGTTGNAAVKGAGAVVTLTRPAFQVQTK
jgi:hypothetical protein